MTWARANRRLLLWLTVVAIVAAVLWTSRGAVAPFAVGLVIAYIIAPLVGRVEADMPEWAQQRGYARMIAVVIVYLIFILVAIAVVAALLPPLLNQVAEFIASLPQLSERLRDIAADAMSTYDAWLIRVTGSAELPPEMSDAVNRLTAAGNLQGIASTTVEAMRGAVLATLGVVRNSISWMLAFVVIPFWLIYVLNDTGRMIDGSLSMIPRAFRADVEAVRLIVDSVLSAYIRGQAVIAIILGVITAAALAVLGVPYALLVGVSVGVLGLIPFLGAILGAIIGIAVALIVSPGLALKTLLTFVVIQQIDNLVVSPRVQGESVALHPALIMVVVILGQNIMGPVGLLVAVPITAILRDVVHFLYLRMGDDPCSAQDALKEVGYPEVIANMRVKPATAAT